MLLHALRAAGPWLRRESADGTVFHCRGASSTKCNGQRPQGRLLLPLYGGMIPARPMSGPLGLRNLVNRGGTRIMNKALGIALLAAGIVLLVFGISEYL